MSKYSNLVTPVIPGYSWIHDEWNDLHSSQMTAVSLPTEWISIPTIDPSDYTNGKVYMLVNIMNSTSEYFKFNFDVGGTIDWGDGTVDNSYIGGDIEHQYDYTNVNLTILDNTRKQALITFTPSTPLTTVDFNILTSIGVSTSPVAISISGNSLVSCNVGLINYFRTDMNNISDWSNFFSDCKTLKTVDLYTSAATTMNSMFFNCYSLRTISLFDTSSVTDMSSMFKNCSSLVVVPLFDTSSVTTMNSMFHSAYYMNQVPKFNITNVTDISYMFYGCEQIKTIPWNVFPAVQTADWVCSGCNALTEISWEFPSASSLTNILNSSYGIRKAKLKTSGVACDLSHAFYFCYGLITIDVDIPNVINLTSFAAYCSSLSNVNIKNTSNVTNVVEMFYNASTLVDAPLFNTSSVTDFSWMFSGCSNLKNIPLFDVSSSTTFNGMFAFTAIEVAPAFILNANLIGVSLSGMFRGCINLLEAPVLNTTGVTDMSKMFYWCYNLRSVPQYDTSSVTTFNSMFYYCMALENVPAFDTTSLLDCGYMFYSCYSLESYGDIDISACTYATNFLRSNYKLRALHNFTPTVSVSITYLGLSSTELNNVYTNLPVVVGKTIYVTGNPGVATDDPSIAMVKGWTVSG